MLSARFWSSQHYNTHISITPPAAISETTFMILEGLFTGHASQGTLIGLMIRPEAEISSDMERSRGQHHRAATIDTRSVAPHLREAVSQ
jgi:hypothetical protein